MGTMLPGFSFWPPTVDAVPLGASLSILAGLGVAVMRRRAIRTARRLPTIKRHLLTEAVSVSAPLPLLVGMYRKRSVQMTIQDARTLFVSVALARYGDIEVASTAAKQILPWGELSRGRLQRLPEPWQLTIRGRQLWLSVPDNGRDPLAMRRRLEFACDLADEWDAANRSVA